MVFYNLKGTCSAFIFETLSNHKLSSFTPLNKYYYEARNFPFSNRSDGSAGINSAMYVYCDIGLISYYLMLFLLILC